MNSFTKILWRLRLFIIKRALKRLTREREIISYARAKRIGLLCGHGDEDHLAFLRSFIKTLEEDNKQVDALGFYQKKRKKENPILPGPIKWCTNTDFTLFLQPKIEHIKQFATQQFDILIDLSSPKAYPLKYIAAIAPAIYKAGANHSDHLNIFDLVLHVKEDCTAADLADHTIHYLKIIKTPEENDRKT